MPSPNITPAMTIAGTEVLLKLDVEFVCGDPSEIPPPDEEIVQRIYMAMEAVREKENG